MEKGKKRRSAKRRAQMNNRNTVRKKMGKRVFFTLTHCNKKMCGISNRYNYKSNMHNLCFVGANFKNVKYQASIMTKCNFRDAKLTGMDFYNCNLRGSSFKNTMLDSVIFYNCNLKDVDFNGASFLDVIFICTNIEVAKNLNISVEGITTLSTYPTFTLDADTEKALLEISNNQSVYEPKVIHVNKGKLNKWNLSIIQSKRGEHGLSLLGRILYKKEKWNNLHTVYSYILLIDNWKSK